MSDIMDGKIYGMMNEIMEQRIRYEIRVRYEKQGLAQNQ